MSCDFRISGKSAEELLPDIAEHAKSAHGIEEIDDQLKQKVGSAIKKRIF
jgi:predicted small metal-binding protein